MEATSIQREHSLGNASRVIALNIFSWDKHIKYQLERTHFSHFLSTQQESFKGKSGRLLFAIVN